MGLIPQWAWGILGLLAALNIARKMADRAAREWHWRVGPRWGRILCVFQRTGGFCFRCGTDFRWALPHDTPVEGGDVFPLCHPCWLECDESSRLNYYSLMIALWRKQGRYDADGGEERYDSERVAIYAAVKAGL